MQADGSTGSSRDSRSSEDLEGQDFALIQLKETEERAETAEIQLAMALADLAAERQASAGLRAEVARLNAEVNRLVERRQELLDVRMENTDLRREVSELTGIQRLRGAASAIADEYEAVQGRVAAIREDKDKKHFISVSVEPEDIMKVLVSLLLENREYRSESYGQFLVEFMAVSGAPCSEGRFSVELTNSRSQVIERMARYFEKEMGKPDATVFEKAAWLVERFNLSGFTFKDGSEVTQVGDHGAGNDNMMIEVISAGGKHTIHLEVEQTAEDKRYRDLPGASAK